MEHTNVRIKLTINPDEYNVFKPLLFFLRSAAFCFSADVREIAPMSSSVENNAMFTLLIIVYHAVLLMVVGYGRRVRKEGDSVRRCV